MDMVMLACVVALFSIIILAGFLQLPALIWTTLIGLTLAVSTVMAVFSTTLLGVLWVFYLIITLIATISGLRQKLIILPALGRLRQQLPPISRTEREAIEAGNVWWEKELFCGHPHWKNLFSIPIPTLTADEQHFIDHQVEKLCGLLDDWEIVHEKHDLPQLIWDYLKKERFFGLVIPKEYGGLGFSALAHSTIVLKIASRSMSAAVNTMVPNSLGPAELLLHYGTDEQKNAYLPRLATGADIPCFALTAPEAGSDAGAIPDNGIVCRGNHQGKEVVGIKLTWNKRYITLAPIATVLGLAVRLYDPEHLIGSVTDIGITLCLIPTSHPGVEIGHRHYPMHLAFMNGPTRGKDVFIPLDWIIGGAKMVGQGWRMLMECLSIGRAISLPALATASGQTIYRFTGAYAKVRRQFNTAIANFEGVEEALSQIAGFTYVMEACRTMTAGAVDLKVKPAIASAIAKYHMTEMSRKVVDHAMDVHAGHMIQTGPRNFLAHLHFAVPISITVEGANILTRNLIIFGQGAIRCHPYLLKEVALISADKPNIDELDRTLMAHVGFFASNFIRTFVYGLTGGHLIQTHGVHRRVKKFQRQLTRMSAVLAILADTSLIMLGGSLKRRERISARLGDMLSQLYLASAVLKFHHDHQHPDDEVDYVCWAVENCLYQAQVACREVLHNYPHPFLAKCLSFVFFPYGEAYQPPSDRLSKHLLTAMLQASSLRNRLTQFCFKGRQGDISDQLDAALTQVDTVDAIMKKIQKAIKAGQLMPHLTTAQLAEAAQKINIITADEAQQWQTFETLKNNIIQVNEFSFDLSKVIA